ncbi:2-amino-4-hydroxy-6-hydroxymethyldihydropteridine diphosphokinase [Deinococcus multiflagellatus]|uniref:2-amino-4-hydroxy-6-hydroxymethyldihydropteridine diphosphokinase n=1 Tax=Deinococcus multiflagellatus TaxID=1656887 RepID=A0ABW1ZLR2_9DEIO
MSQAGAPVQGGPAAPLTDAFIALGANLGNPAATLAWAAGHLRALGEVTGVSRLYRTAPVGAPGQPDYLNAAVQLRTRLDAPALLAALHALEAQAGRERRQRWEARLLDLDLILYGQQQCEGPGLVLPHPRAWERPFVLAPSAT